MGVTFSGNYINNFEQYLLECSYNLNNKVLIVALLFSSFERIWSSISNLSIVLGIQTGIAKRYFNK